MNETSQTKDPTIPAMPAFRRRVSWGAIWGGMFVALVLLIMFTFLGIACGIATLNPAYNPPSAPSGFSVGAAIWLMLSWLIAIGVGAYVGGWMSGGPRSTDGTMHGMVVWSFAAAVILLLLTGAAGSVLGQSGWISGGMTAATPSSYHQTVAITSAHGGAVLTARQPMYEQQDENGGLGTMNGNAGTIRGGAGPHGIWGDALWTFIALALGLGVAAVGGSKGAASSERSLPA